MRFEWDERKSASNLRKHGIDFSFAAFAFGDPMQLIAPDSVVNGEERWRTTGMALGKVLVLVVHTIQDENEEVLRIISAREANSHERRIYEEDSL